MLTAQDVMKTEIISIDPDDTIEVAVQALLDNDLTSLPVVDDTGRLLGVVSEFDLLELAWDSSILAGKVYEHMTRDVHEVSESEPIGHVAQMFRLLSVRQLPVTHEGRLVGTVSRADVLRSVVPGCRPITSPVVTMPNVEMPNVMPPQGPAVF